MAKKIVIIDDDRVTLTMLSMLLARRKFEVFTASNGAEGLDLIRKEKPEVVICDMLIPKIDGLSLCKEVKEDPAIGHIHVILMSAVYKDSSFRAEAKASGAWGFIEKPFDTKDLLSKLDRIQGIEKPSD